MSQLLYHPYLYLGLITLALIILHNTLFIAFLYSFCLTFVYACKQEYQLLKKEVNVASVRSLKLL